MSYSNNPLLPKARAEAVRLVVEQRVPLTVAARKSGIHRSTLWRWRRRWLVVNSHVQLTNDNRPTRQPGRQFRQAAIRWSIPTLSSRPHHSPQALPPAIVDRIVYWREHRSRCAMVVHAHCLAEGAKVSLASVKRVLKRLHLLRSVSKWKRYRKPVPRPHADRPGDLVQTDTIHLVNVITKQRVYLYTLVDVHSRWAYAEYHDHLSQRLSYGFLCRGQAQAGFQFACVQADNGPEFGTWLKDMLQSDGTILRHSRVRRPNDNAFIERFNRTVQEECLEYRFPKPETVHSQLQDYLAYYNEERLHLGLQCVPPASVLHRS